MGYKLNGKDLPLDTPFSDSEGFQYPPSWLRNSTESQRAAVPTGGITWVEPAPWYDKGFYTALNTPKDLAKLKTYWVAEQKHSARLQLAEYDWYVTRKAETGTAIPTNVANYRAAVRTQSGLREATINACSDVDTLCKKIRDNYPQTIAGTASNGATEKFDTSKEKKDGSGNSFDPKQYESFDPKQWNDVRNPDRIEPWPETPTQVRL